MENTNAQPVLLLWDNAAMATGIPQIDEQHQELIAKINELYRIHQAGATVDDIKAMLKFLGEYVKKHFHFEENLMEESKCPMRGTNCIAHARFLQEYQELVSNFSISQDVDQTASEIERKAARWLVAHICGVDVSLRNAVKA
jgi:hemerythrin